MLTQKLFINPTDLSTPIPKGLIRIAILPNHQTTINMARQGGENKNSNFQLTFLTS